MTVRRGYVTAGGRLVHYRVCGQGPAVVMLHDSPRSSRLHLGTMAALADSFQVFALDTPGYGNSEPLGLAEPSVTDFAAALGEALTALGLEGAPLYATHTSAKIALALAARGGTMPRLVLDGLSIPERLSPPEFVATYMRPFRIDDSGAYLAAEWGRTRDMLRWFPWFTPTPAARMIMEPPSPEWMADYGIDLFSAGPTYSDAYAAAMRWDPMPDLLSVSTPTLVAARSDDVLYGYLDRVPVSDNPRLSVERLGTDREAWLAWLRQALADAAPTPAKPVSATGQAARAGYLDLPHGQMHWRRSGAGDPVLILSAPSTLQADAWAEALASSYTALVPELPGYGDSDALPSCNADALADALAAFITAEADGRATVLGVGLAAPLAARLAARHPAVVSQLVIDGMPPADADEAARFAAGLFPDIAFDPHAGTHLHKIWHMLRDGEVQWPWHDGSPAAARKLAPSLSGLALHRALTGLLKQPVAWSAAAQAALAGAANEDWAGLRVPTTFFTHADPAFAAAAQLAQIVPGARLVERADAASADDLARALDHTSVTKG